MGKKFEKLMDKTNGYIPLYMLASKKSVSWWQQALQDAVDVIEMGSQIGKPNYRVLVTTAMARETRAYALYTGQKEDSRWTIGINVRGLVVRVNSWYENAVFEVGYYIFFKYHNGTIIPQVKVHSQMEGYENDTNYENYDELYTDMNMAYGKARELFLKTPQPIKGGLVPVKKASVK